MRLSLALTLSHLRIWWFELMDLFLFLLAKAALASLPTVHFLALRSHLPFRQAQYVQVFSLKPAPFCKLFAVLGSTNKSAMCLFLLFDSRSILSSVFPFTAISLADLAKTLFSILLYNPATIGPQSVIYAGQRRCRQVGEGVRYSCHQQSLSPLTSCIHSCLFLD